MSFRSVTADATFRAHQFFLGQGTILEIMLSTALPAHEDGALFKVVSPLVSEATHWPLIVEDIYLI